MVNRMTKNLVCGVGINDAGYSVRQRSEGRSICKFYQTWRDMLFRCYVDSYKRKRPNYAGCIVSNEWLYFSNFKKWMETQDWQGKHLDKDILIAGNKIYSEETCVFVDAVTNTFITDCGRSRGLWPIGVSWQEDCGRFKAQCRNPFIKKLDYLGLFYCQEAAHHAWKNRKHKHALRLADLQSDPRVAAALRTRYL
jgi:hypothetical protein